MHVKAEDLLTKLTLIIKKRKIATRSGFFSRDIISLGINRLSPDLLEFTDNQPLREKFLNTKKSKQTRKRKISDETLTPDKM